jgi:hypothetical protein
MDLRRVPESAGRSAHFLTFQYSIERWGEGIRYLKRVQKLTNQIRMMRAKLLP